MISGIERHSYPIDAYLLSAARPDHVTGANTATGLVKSYQGLSILRYSIRVSYMFLYMGQLSISADGYLQKTDNDLFM